MSLTPNKKLVENEVIFRQRNDAMRDQVKQLLQSEARDMPLEFYCECSNEDCHERIRLEPSEYSNAHANRRSFITLPGHETIEIEKVTERNAGYNVVEKHDQPSYDTDMKLNKTDL